MRTSPVEEFLSRLDKVKRVGNGYWTACCPVHDDSHPSLSITEKSGTFVVHCHACHAGGVEIIESVGLTANDFYEKMDVPTYIKSLSRKWTANQICELGSESMSIVALLLERLMKKGLEDEEIDLLRLESQKLIILFGEVSHG